MSLNPRRSPSQSKAKSPKGPFGWRSGKVGGWKIVRGWKIFSFLSCVFGWRDRKVGGWKTLLFG